MKVKKIRSLLNQLNLGEKIICIILLIITFINTFILVEYALSPNQIPDFFGYKPFIIATDILDSEINENDLMITKKTKSEKIKEGDIIAFRKKDYITIGRIQEKKGNEVFVTYNDNKSIKIDVLNNEIEGKKVCSIPHLGKIILKINENSVVILLIILLSIITLYYAPHKK